MAAESFRDGAHSLVNRSTEMSDLDAIVNRLIDEYKKSHAISETPSVFSSTYRPTERVGAYNLDTVHETAEQLLLQLKKDKEEKATEQRAIELEGKPPLLVLAKRVRTFTTYSWSEETQTCLVLSGIFDGASEFRRGGKNGNNARR